MKTKRDIDMDSKWVKDLKLDLIDWSEKEIELLFNNPKRLGKEKLLYVYNVIVDIALERLDHWCWEVYVSPVEDCYAAHADLTLGDIIDLYIYEGDFSRFEEGIYEALEEKMGKEELEKYMMEKIGDIRSRIEEVIEELRKDSEKLEKLLLEDETEVN